MLYTTSVSGSDPEPVPGNPLDVFKYEKASCETYNRSFVFRSDSRLKSYENSI